MPFKIVNKPTEVTYEVLTLKEETFLTHRNHLIPYCPKAPLFFPHFQLYNEQIPIIFNDSDTTNMIQNIFYTPYDISDFAHNVFDEDPFCKENDDQLIMFIIDLYESTKLDVNHHHHHQSKSVPENL